MNEKNLIKLNFKKISKDNYEFIFNCGDLFTRENVSWDKDLEYCIKIFKNVEFKNIKSLKLDIKYSMPNIYDIDYLCGARYRGELKGQYRHGVGAITYSEDDEPIIGFWKHDKMVHGGIEHPTKSLEAIAVTQYEGRKRS